MESRNLREQAYFFDAWTVSKLQKAKEVVMDLHGQGSNVITNWLMDSRNWLTFACPMFDRCAMLRFVIYLTVMNPESLWKPVAPGSKRVLAHNCCK